MTIFLPKSYLGTTSTSFLEQLFGGLELMTQEYWLILPLLKRLLRTYYSNYVDIYFFLYVSLDIRLL